jgi:hypothetical protein
MGESSQKKVMKPLEKVGPTSYLEALSRSKMKPV